MKQKLELYILSLWLLFILVFINKVSIPVCFKNCEFIGIKELLLTNYIPLFCLVFILMGCWFYLRFRHTVVSGSSGLPEKIVSVKNLNWEHLTFLVTYIIPLVSFELDFNLAENRNTLMFFLVLIIIGAIYISTNMFYTNPTLALLGYQIYEIEAGAESKRMIVITRGTLLKDDWIRKRHINDNIYFAVKKDK